MTTLQDVVGFIQKADRSELDRIFDAAKRRSTAATREQAELNAATLKKGDKVRTVNLKPKYLSHLTGTVEDVRGADRILVTMNDKFGLGRYGSGPNGDQLLVPASCLEAL